jgi:hypothetical protein
MYNGIIGKARNRIAGHYRLGAGSNISDQIQWLLEQSHFLYGEVDIEVRSAFSTFHSSISQCTP